MFSLPKIIQSVTCGERKLIVLSDWVQSTCANYGGNSWVSTPPRAHPFHIKIWPTSYIRAFSAIAFNPSLPFFLSSHSLHSKFFFLVWFTSQPRSNTSTSTSPPNSLEHIPHPGRIDFLSTFLSKRVFVCGSLLSFSGRSLVLSKAGGSFIRPVHPHPSPSVRYLSLHSEYR